MVVGANIRRIHIVVRLFATTIQAEHTIPKQLIRENVENPMEVLTMSIRMSGQREIVAKFL